MPITHNNIPHIVFLFSDTGGGHRSAAEAILEAMSSEFPGKMTAEMVDIFRDYAPARSMLAIAFLPLIVLTTQYFGDTARFGTLAMYLAVTVICIAAAAHQAWSANLFTTVSDMFPKKAIGSMVGIGTMAGGVGGIIIQLLSGRLNDVFKATPKTAYLIMFCICALGYVTAWSIMKILVPRHKPITDL
jgi:ACS family hexuronate transporter-like MFS transporter